MIRKKLGYWFLECMHRTEQYNTFADIYAEKIILDNGLHKMRMTKAQALKLANAIKEHYGDK